MHCPRCDAQIESTYATCPHCGEEIGQVTAPTPAQRRAGPRKRLSLPIDDTRVTPTPAPTTVPKRSYELRPLPHLVAFVSVGIIVSLIAIVVLNHLLLGGGQTKQPDSQSPNPSNSLGGPHIFPTATQPKPQPTTISRAPTVPAQPLSPTPTLPVVTVATAVDSGSTPTADPTLKTPTPNTPAPGSFVDRQLPFNNVGTSSDSNTSIANYDNLGNSYSLEQLQIAGITPGAIVILDNRSFYWPAFQPGTPDNVVAAGQTITFDRPVNGNTLALLGGAIYGPVSATATITYADGTTQTIMLTYTDWVLNCANSPPSSVNTMVITMPYRNLPNNEHEQCTTGIFESVFPLNATKAVVSLTLPQQGELHINALTITNG